MMQEIYFTLTIGGYLLGAIAGLSLRKTNAWMSVSKNIGLIFAGIASLSGCFLSVSVLLSGSPFRFELGQNLPFGSLSVNVDALSAFFVGVISLLGLIVSLYSIGYNKEFVGRRSTGLLGLLHNLFLLSMVLVVAANNAIFFLIVWELMSLATYFLISFEHELPSSRRAAILYIVMTHIGTAFLIAMFLLFASYAHSFNFDDFRTVAAGIPLSAKTWMFLCGLIGFGIKAGIIPLHIWLPEAHPAAPSNISALMSGVMIKTGIYGIVRVLFDFLGPGPAWWGILILAVAVISAVLGVLYALMEHDLKRLLAFHSIENIGIILMGIGAAALFSSFGNIPLAAMALIAGLYHVFNHAIFKGLLFLGAGSVLHSTHTRNIEELGGLAKRLPWTALFFLVGSAAISALPPLNGFMSEWLTFQSLLLGFHIPELTVKLSVAAAVALLALTGALAAACFVKAFGITFLGLPRSSHAGEAHESSPSMLIPMGALALLCIVLGVAPGLMLSVLNPVSGSLLGAQAPAVSALNPGSLTIPQLSASGVSPSVLALFLLGLVVVPVLAGAVIGGRLRKRTAMVWACGLERVDARMQYTATGFSKPIRMIFSNIYRATHEVEISEETSSYYLPTIRYELKTESIFEKYFYDPVRRAVVEASKFVRRLQTGHVQSYLAYIFIILILLLIFAR